MSKGPTVRKGPMVINRPASYRAECDWCIRDDRKPRKKGRRQVRHKDKYLWLCEEHLRSRTS